MCSHRFVTAAGTGAPYDVIDGNAPAIAACALAEHDAASGWRGNSAAAAFTNDLSLTEEERGRASPGPELGLEPEARPGNLGMLLQ